MSLKTIFKLQLATDPHWVKNVVESNIEEILTDHAYCEQKAATNAITLIIQNPNISELVQQMSQLVIEEMGHFKQVHEIILKRGFILGQERKDNYVNELIKFLKRGGGEQKRIENMVDRLLLAAMIEARSCERFKVLAQYINDVELAAFYNELMISEAGHYTLFLGLARKYGEGIDVEKRWQEWLDYEGSIIKDYAKTEGIHG